MPRKYWLTDYESSLRDLPDEQRRLYLDGSWDFTRDLEGRRRADLTPEQGDEAEVRMLASYIGKWGDRGHESRTQLAREFLGWLEAYRKSCKDAKP